MKPFGVLCPIVTPCSRSGEIDRDGLVSVARYMLNNGCAGLFVCGSTGRGPWFDLKSKVAICKTVREEVGSDVPLYAGCAGSGLPDMLANAEAMRDAGAQVAVLTLPGYFAYSQNEIETIFMAFADKSALDVMIYDIPAFTGNQLDNALITRLARHERVIGFKDSSADYARFVDLLSVLNSQPDFYLMQGKENILGNSILRGASGLVCSLLHITPEPFVNLYLAASTGKQAQAETLQEKITAIMEIVEYSFSKCSESSTLFHILNYALKTRGVCDNILLEHEGDCPKWLADEAKKATEIC